MNEEDKVAERRAHKAAAAWARRQDPAVRAREAAERCQCHADPEIQAREAEAARKRWQENLEEVRARDAAAKRRNRSLPEVGGADARFKRVFLDHTSLYDSSELYGAFTVYPIISFTFVYFSPCVL